MNSPQRRLAQRRIDQQRLDVFRVSVQIMGKWEQLSSHPNESDALSKARQVGSMVIDMPVRISTRSGETVYELNAASHSACPQ